MLTIRDALQILETPLGILSVLHSEAVNAERLKIAARYTKFTKTMPFRDASLMAREEWLGRWLQDRETC